tara:strand:- start:43963 stop:44838 length:876 start_codon:yes stop_codon:yes gene_type:complete
MQTQFLPIAIIAVMLSLGLTLTVSDFRRIARIPGPIAVALLCQAVLLPIIAFLIARGFALPGTLAVGLMLISAAPGGTFANVFSHLAGGDLALNLTLTAINAVLAIVTLPLIVSLSMIYFMGDDRSIPLQFSKALQVVLLMAGPIAVGMFFRHRFPNAAQRLRKPVNILVGVFVVLVAVFSVKSAWGALVEHFAVLGAAVVLLNVISLAVGYIVPRLMHLSRRQAIAISVEVGLHNAALAMTIGSSPQLLGNSEIAISGIMYGVTMPFIAVAFIALIRRMDRDTEPPTIEA